MTPRISWDNLVAHGNSLEAAFEQLVKVLARHDERFVSLPRGQFQSNGNPDGGIECLWTKASGSQHGYQAKFHRSSLGSSQWQQLDDSVKKVLESYPKLDALTIVIPQDLPHSPRQGQITAREKWLQRCEKWQDWAAKEGRTVRVDLWDETHIVGALAKTDASGLYRFFFGKDLFSTTHLQKLALDATRAVGPRYRPELHVDVDTQRHIEWLTLEPVFVKHLQGVVERFERLLSRTELSHLGGGDTAKPFSKIHGQLDRVRRALGEGGLSHLASLIDGLHDSVQVELDTPLWRIRPEPPDQASPQTEQSFSREMRLWEGIYAIVSECQSLVSELGGGNARGGPSMSDRRVVMLTGPGGSGKTHLLCDAVSKLAKRGFPAILLLGQSLNARTFLTDSPIGGVDNIDDLLELLNAAAEVSGTRALLCIDGINESVSPSAWPQTLRMLKAKVDRLSRITLMISARDVYSDTLFPRADEPDEFYHLTHNGFGSATDTALEAYCEYFNISLPSVPPLDPAFENPLFLSIFCQVAACPQDSEGNRPLASFPSGERGFGDLFEAYVKDIGRRLRDRFNVLEDASREPLRTAIAALCREMSRRRVIELPATDVAEILALHLAGNTPLRGWRAALEDEGLLITTWLRDSTGTPVEHQRFSFDRLHCYFLVQAWLSGTDDTGGADVVLGANGQLADNYRGPLDRSLCEEVVAQWPACYRLELFDTVPELADDVFWAAAFVNSLAWRSRSSWGERTACHLKAAFEVLRTEQLSVCRDLVRLMARPDFPELAVTCHEYLNSLSLPARDAWWTRGLVEDIKSQAINRLISYCLADRPSARNTFSGSGAATALAWLCATTHRIGRSRSCRALANVLHQYLEGAPQMLEQFSTVNDEYIREAICAAVYGACLRSLDTQLVCKCADAVVECYPLDTNWPTSILARHALSGVVECAAQLDDAYSGIAQRYMPPYSSVFPSNIQTWEQFEELAQSSDDPKWNGFQRIVSSCRPESRGAYGDFGRYSVGGVSTRFRATGESVPGHDDGLDSDLVQRYIVGRVLELGWTADLFGVSDAQNHSGSRDSPSVERVGKKYQWIAFSEILGYLSDNYHFVGWDGNHSQLTLMHPSDLSRYWFTDPSVPYRSVEKHAVGSFDTTVDIETEWDEPDDATWTLSSSDIPDPLGSLTTDVTEDRPSGVLLAGKVSAQQHIATFLASDRRYRCLSLCARAFMFEPGGEQTLLDAFKQREAVPSDFESTAVGLFFGELFWTRAARSLEEVDGVVSPWVGSRSGLPVRAIPLAGHYVNESDADDGTISVDTPSVWLASALGIRAGATDFNFVDACGKQVCWQHSSCTPDRLSGLYIDASIMGEHLQREGLLLGWYLWGSKFVVDGSADDGPLVSDFQGIYLLREGSMSGYLVGFFDEFYHVHGRRGSFMPRVASIVYQSN